MKRFTSACMLLIATLALVLACLRSCAQDTLWAQPHIILSDSVANINGVYVLFSMPKHKAQDASKGRWVRYALFAVSVTSSAIGDGLNSRTKYAAGHTLSALSYATLIAIPFVSHKATWKQPATYLLLRYALFDALYNVGAKRNLNYIGGKNYYDESVGKVPLPVLHATKFTALALSIVINLK